MSIARIRFAARKSCKLFLILLLLTTLFSACLVIHATTRIIDVPWLDTRVLHQTNFELVDICPNTLVDFSDECQKELDAHFGEMPLEYPSTSWISLPNRLTYGGVFEDPIGDRQRVFDALQREQCRLESGELVRWDLKESCHADAFANLSVFIWICNQESNLQDLANAIVDPIDIAHLASDLQLYKGELRSRILNFLQARWFKGECNRFDFSEIRIDAKRDREQYEVLRSTAIRLDTLWPKYGNIPEAFVLKSLAALLGDESSVMLYDRDQSSDSWRQHIDKTWPWNIHLRQIHWHSLYDLPHEPPDTSSRLRVGIATSVSLQDSGLEFDWNILVREVCTRTNPEHATCRSAIDDVRLTLEWNQTSELRALDKFEEVSKELNLFK